MSASRESQAYAIATLGEHVPHVDVKQAGKALKAFAAASYGG